MKLTKYGLAVAQITIVVLILMRDSGKQIVLLLLISTTAAIGVWALLRFTAPLRVFQRETSQSARPSKSTDDLWTEGIAKVKEDRGEDTGAADVPPQLRHYTERRWFLATQVAEVRKYNVQTCQDFLDLAAMIERGELEAIPPATEEYILYGVGATADTGRFSRYDQDGSVELFTETQLSDEYGRLEHARANLRTQIENARSQLTALKRRDRGKQRELQKEIAAREQEMKSLDDTKALLDRNYGTAASRQRLFQEYESLQGLAKNFAGRSYDLDSASDRQVMKVNLLRSLRPQALKILRELASAYHAKFDRPLPVSSLVRPEQYQRALRKVNRAAVLIDTPPHSTGLAFDIDYRYMGASEQSFVMGELARLKDEGRIEVLRERGANYHVFAFVQGTRPGDDLITASLEQAGAASDKEANHPTRESLKSGSKTQKPKRINRPKARKRR